ncbi:hypothetical protein [Streptosporangium sandarakinum]|uniref:Uncharacterized protein n=1 Tax=Streptosporangium sandarakinum TaxID=1260955 RepID=A0A852V0L4_9ACTN|nr:hypothetical protein [Streptosporangium sandarakinum]NYF40814.1 hypothetical protein [Streptosporangium sandarakinum]
MRRWIVLTVAALIASVPVTAVPAAAQAGSPDPVQAVKRQFRDEHGVQLAEVTRLLVNKESAVRIRNNARLQLSRSGPVAFDATWQMVAEPELEKLLKDGDGDGGVVSFDFFAPSSVTVVGGKMYVSSDLYRKMVPQDKEFVRTAAPADLKAVSSQTINVFEPAVLKTMLKGAKRTSAPGGFLYQGTTSHAELSKASPKTYAGAFGRESARQAAKKTISWRIWTNGDGLVQRMLSTETARLDKKLSMTFRTDTRYTDWGMPITVVAPPADKVVDEKDLKVEDLFDFSDPKEIVNTVRR